MIDEAKANSVLREEKRVQRCYSRAFSGKDGKAILDDLEKHFETNLPCFQGSAGNFDPLDAMRRDAFRELMLYVRRKVSQGEKQTEKEEL
ncbi:MAG: hypothetical protein RR553_03250 [Akkermansia sp.]